MKRPNNFRRHARTLYGLLLVLLVTAGPAAAATIWNGIGMNAQNSPTATAPETERRFKCQRLGSCSQSPNSFSDWCSRILW